MCVFVGIKPPTLAGSIRFTVEPNSKVYVAENASSFLVPCKAMGEQPVHTYWRNESVLNPMFVVNTTNEGLWFRRQVQALGHRVGTFRCMAKNTAGVVMGKKFEVKFIREYKTFHLF